ncbi:MAG: methyltransferase domain-containing protein [Pseudomonas sp.]
MKLNVDDVMHRVRNEMVRRGRKVQDASESLSVNAQLAPLAWASAVPALAMKTEYVLGELLAHSDQAFIEAAYAAVLRRSPDPEGMSTYLGNLLSGAMSKVEVIAALRWSPEGESKGVHVDGLLVPYLLQKWRRKRIFGPVLGWLQAFARLPVLFDRIARVDILHAREAHELGRFTNRLGAQIDARFGHMEHLVASEQHQRLEGLESRIGEALGRDDQFAFAMEAIIRRADAVEDRLADSARSLSGWRQDIIDQIDAAIFKQNERLAVLASDVGTKVDAFNKHIQNSNEEQQERIAALAIAVGAQLEATDERLRVAAAQHGTSIARLDDAFESQKQQLVQHAAAFADMQGAHQSHQTADRALDSLYVAFEERFRGARELIRARVLPYVEILREAQVGTLAAPVLDIGCGRGDWLDVMREHHLVARGVDTNGVFVELCRGRGLDVAEADALEMLTGLPDGSLGGVTGLHIAEHLPFETLVRLLDECRRVICIGGVLVLETPNPENLQVAALYFYNDPTHRNPLPPETLRWIVEARGFERARIERLTEARELDVPPLLDDDLPGAGSVNFLLQQLHAAPDYAVVARRL